MIQKIKKFFIARPDLLCRLAIMFIGLHVFIGLKPGLLYIGGDTGIPLNPLKNLNLLYLWQNQEGGVVGLNLGIVFQLLFFIFFKLAGLSLALSQHLYIYFSHALAGLAMFYLVNSFSLNHKRLIGLVAAVFYMFSPWLINYLGIFVFLPYSVIPYILGFFVRGLTGQIKPLKSILLIILLMLGVIVNFPQYSMYFVTFLLLFLYLIFYLSVGRGNLRKALKFCLLLAVIFILTSLWYLLPYWRVFSYQGIGSKLTNTVLVSDNLQNFGDYGSSTLLHLWRLFGAAGFMKGGATYSQPYLSNPLLILLSFFIPLLVFGAMFYKPKSKTVLFFSLTALIFIFIAKGVNPPFGFLHFYLVNHFPLARAFRTTWNLSLGANLAFAVLVGTAIVETAYFLVHKAKAIKFLILGLLGLLVVNSWPLLTGDYFTFSWNPPTFGGVKIPSAYFELEDFLAKNQGDFRFFRFPFSRGTIKTDWGYNGSDFFVTLFSTPFISAHPIAEESRFLAQSIYERFSQKPLLDSAIFNLLSLLNVNRLVIDHYDVTSKQKIDLDLPEQFNGFSLFSLDDRYLLPRFYLPENLIFSNASPKDYLKIIDFPDYRQKSAIFPLESMPKLATNSFNREIILISKSTVSLELEEQKQRLLDDFNQNNSFRFLPYARWRPGTLIYSLILKKEALDLHNSQDFPDIWVEKNLFLAGKRIVEFDRWGQSLSQERQKQTIKLYEQFMTRAFDQLKQTNPVQNPALFISLLQKIQLALDSHEKRVSDDRLEKIFADFHQRLNAINQLPDLSSFTYNFDIPEAGNYALYFKPGAMAGTINLEKGKYQTTSFNSNFNLLTNHGWQNNQKPGVIDQPIKNFQPDTYYQLSFDYQIETGSVRLSVIQDVDVDSKTGQINPRVSRTLSQTSTSKPTHFSTLFKSGADARSASVDFSTALKLSGAIKINNVRLQAVYQPEAFLRKQTSSSLKTLGQKPSVSFDKISPTKYRVKVENSLDPYILVFSESLHPGWKIYPSSAGNERFLANGYANAWLIEDKFDYLVEFEPQRYFYFGALISLSVFIICLFYLRR